MNFYLLLHYSIYVWVITYISQYGIIMNLNVKNNINVRIKELDTEIQGLENKLAAKIWERKKYVQFSRDNNPKNYISK